MEEHKHAERLARARAWCAWCGTKLNGNAYLFQGLLAWCSERCWRLWHRHHEEPYDDDVRRWENDGGS